MRYKRILPAGLAALFSCLVVFCSSRFAMHHPDSRSSDGPSSPRELLHSDKAAAVPVPPIGPRWEGNKTGYSFFNLPVAFEMNEGQAPPGVKFTARGRGYALHLTSSEAVFKLAGPSRLSSQLDAEN